MSVLARRRASPSIRSATSDSLIPVVRIRRCWASGLSPLPSRKGDDVALEHGLDFSGDSGQDEEQRVASLEQKPRRRSTVVLDRSCAFRQHGCRDVGLGHREIPGIEPCPDLLENFLVEHQLAANQSRHGLLRAVVGGDAQTSRGDDELSALESTSRLLLDGVDNVGHRRHAHDRSTQRRETLPEIGSVQVYLAAVEKLSAYCYHLGIHCITIRQVFGYQPWTSSMTRNSRFA